MYRRAGPPTKSADTAILGHLTQAPRICASWRLCPAVSAAANLAAVEAAPAGEQPAAELAPAPEPAPSRSSMTRPAAYAAATGGVALLAR